MPIVPVFPDSTGGGAAYVVTPPAATTDPQLSGSGLGNKTFGAFGGADAGSITGYSARTVNASGVTSWSGSGLGPYTPSGDADGSAGVLALDALIGSVVVATALHDYAIAGASGAGLSAILDIDWAALFGVHGAYNFLTTGGSGGTGGDGNHSYGGFTFVLNGTTAGLTQLEVTANGLEATQSSGAFVLGVDLRALTPALDPSGLCRCIAIWASAASSGGDGVQVGLRRNAAIGTWEAGDTVVRYRKADATPDLYGITYNGSSYDVLASGTVTASGDVRMQVDLDNQQGAVVRGDTGTSTDPADSDTLAEFARVAYARSYASFAGTYPGDTSYWALVGIGGNASGICTRLIVYGLEA